METEVAGRARWQGLQENWVAAVAVTGKRCDNPVAPTVDLSRAVLVPYKSVGFIPVALTKATRTAVKRKHSLE